MANTFTALAPTLFSAAKKVANEPFGAVSAIDTRFDNKGVAKGDTVKIDVAPTRAASDFTPAATTSSGSDATGTSIDVSITKSRKVSWHLTGEQIRSLDNATIRPDWVEQLMMQGMRTLRNEAEVDAIAAIRKGGSRAYGTAGTTPFASDLSLLTNLRKILHDNGAPLADLQYVANTAAGLNLRNLGVFQNAYQAGSDSERRTGNFLPQMGFTIRESAGISAVTAGTGASYLLNGALAVGDTTITVDTGSGTILAGDIVTFAGTTDKYVVNTALASTTFTIGSPGSRAVEADNDAVSVGAAFTPSLAFERNAVVGVLRPPLIPANPTIQQMLISDSYGMTYLLLDIAQYGQRTWELHLAWGFAVANSEFVAVGLG